MNGMAEWSNAVDRVANELFDQLDTDKDGKVSKEELRKAFGA